jgi:outer membrane lipoprotein SlyB
MEIVAGLSQKSGSKKKRNAAIIGGSAAGGALLGRMIGKDTKGAVVGAIAGGAVGTGVVMSKEGEQVKLPAGTEMTIKLEESIRVPERS